MDVAWVGRARGRRAAWRLGSFGPSAMILAGAVLGCGVAGPTSSGRNTSPASPAVGLSGSPIATGSVFASASPTLHGVFTVTGSMTSARIGQAAALLQDGRVLIAGGSSQSKVDASAGTAELYDPQTRTFSQTGPMNNPRALGATASLLPDGEVLMAGGCENWLDPRAIAAAELYDPATGKFTPTGSMADARYDQTATTLLDGRILVLGGYDSLGHTLASAELYDPAAGKFLPTGSMALPRSGHAATLLPDGRVLIVGGTSSGAYNDKAPTTAELYDPKTGRFAFTGSPATPRWGGHTATLLEDGRVLVAGGNSSSVQEEPVASAELYDPKTGRFSKTGSMAQARDGHTATRLLDGQVLVAGGADNPAELYDPQAGVFGSTGSTVVMRGGHSATLLGDGEVLIVGGTTWPAATVVPSAELYQP